MPGRHVLQLYADFRKQSRKSTHKHTRRWKKIVKNGIVVDFIGIFDMDDLLL